MKIDGRPFLQPDLEDHLIDLEFGAWRPTHVCIHHCAAPSLAQRPGGFLPQHMLNLKSYYEGLGWKSGPHIFTDEDQAWMFTPLTQRGVHAVSFNRDSWGIEMLGDYDVEDPWSGRGLRVLTMTARVTAALLRKLKKDVGAIRFHREDPKTRKSCPGRKVDKSKFVALVAAAL